MRKDANMKLAICSGSFQNDIIERRILISDILELAVNYSFDAVADKNAGRGERFEIDIFIS